MKVRFYNQWNGCSMKDGGTFPITLIDINADIHPSYKTFDMTLFNFGLVIHFKKKQKESTDAKE